MIFYAADFIRATERGHYPRLKAAPPKHVLASAGPLILKLPQKITQGIQIRSEAERKAACRRILRGRRATGCQLVVDSGVYGLMAKACIFDNVQTNSRTKFDFDRIRMGNTAAFWIAKPRNLIEYSRAYYEHIIPMLWDEIDWFVETDLHHVVPDIEEHREIAKAAGVWDKIMLVDHLGDAGTFSAMLDRCPRWSLPAYDLEAEPWRVTMLYKKQGTLHGLGISAPDELLHVPYHSIDSTKWAAPRIWGRLDRWNPYTKRLEIVPVSRRCPYWHDWRRVHGDVDPMALYGLPEAISEEAIDVLLVEQLHQYDLMMKDVTDYWRERGVEDSSQES